MESVQIHDKTFEPYISSEKIQAKIAELAKRIAADHKDEVPIFIGVLNGAFRFCSDLLSHFQSPAEISFLKLASYEGTESTGKINDLVSLNIDLKGRKVVVLEDIVDTGRTVDYLMKKLRAQEPDQIKVASLLLKPEIYTGSYKIDYCGFEIPNFFVVGYGLDYDGLGRNLNAIYQIKS